MKRILISLAVTILLAMLILGIVLSCASRKPIKPAVATPTPIHASTPVPTPTIRPYHTPVLSPSLTPEEGNG